MKKLEEIIASHEERGFLREPYNPRIDYSKEAVQQYYEVQYLLCIINSVLKLARAGNVKGRKKDGKNKTKRAASRKRCMQ